MAGVREYRVDVEGAELFVREVGAGRPLVVIHGGPDFDHTILLPDFDRLADGYRLVYYDQRGRGRSRGRFDVADARIERYVSDLDALRAALGLDAVAILGHSWGGVVAMHYALAHPGRTAALILLNTAPATHDDYRLMCEERERRNAPHADRLEALENDPRFVRGEPDVVAAYYRLDFASGFKDPALAARLCLQWTQDDVVRGRAIEDRLAEGLYWREGFTLLPALAALQVPTLVVHGADDFVPPACAARIADAIPGARLAVITDCGHFAYIEAPGEMRRAIDGFLASGRGLTHMAKSP